MSHTEDIYFEYFEAQTYRQETQEWGTLFDFASNDDMVFISKEEAQAELDEMDWLPKEQKRIVKVCTTRTVVI